jgi:hypothetical protein
VTDRYSADSITSDALDQLYARMERAEHLVESFDAIADTWLRDGTTEPTKVAGRYLRRVLDEARPPSGPAATQATEEQDLARALGGDRTAQTIAHTLTVHGHTLNAVRTMTYAELLAVPGIGGPSLARIRAALDGEPEPDAAAAADATEPVRQADADQDDPPVQCWHTEADTPCDWDVCKQPERLAAGDYGTDPREQH